MLDSTSMSFNLPRAQACVCHLIWHSRHAQLTHAWLRLPFQHTSIYIIYLCIYKHIYLYIYLYEQWYLHITARYDIVYIYIILYIYTYQQEVWHCGNVVMWKYTLRNEMMLDVGCDALRMSHRSMIWRRFEDKQPSVDTKKTYPGSKFVGTQYVRY